MAADPARASRELLYGDVPLAKWAAIGTGIPWAMLGEAADNIASGRLPHAADLLLAVARNQALEARQRLEAWTALRGISATPPPAVAAKLEGVVVDVVMPRGRDSLAVYRDPSAVYIDFSGTVKYARNEARYTDLLRAVLAAGHALLPNVAPWQGARPPVPDTHGTARVSLLTAAGYSIGQGQMNVLMSDPLGGPVLNAAVALLGALSQ
jgi:hypothetical protein